MKTIKSLQIALERHEQQFTMSVKLDGEYIFEDTKFDGYEFYTTLEQLVLDKIEQQRKTIANEKRKQVAGAKNIRTDYQISGA